MLGVRIIIVQSMFVYIYLCIFNFLFLLLLFLIGFLFLSGIVFFLPKEFPLLFLFMYIYPPQNLSAFASDGNVFVLPSLVKDTFSSRTQASRSFSQHLQVILLSSSPTASVGVSAGRISVPPLMEMVTFPLPSSKTSLLVFGSQ